MARIDLEKKKTGGMGWLWALLLLVALALLLWWLWGAWSGGSDAAVDSEYAGVEEPAAPAAVPEVEEESTAGAGLPVAQIVADPESWFDRSVSGQVGVVEVPTDRGFWIEQDGERLFALIVDRPAEVPLDIQTGQTLRLSDARVHRAEAALEEGGIPGTPLDADTRRIAQGEEAILVVDESDIETL